MKLVAVDKTKNAQVLVTIPKDLLKRIEDFQFGNRIKNRNEAIRELIDKGLSTTGK